MEKRKIQRSGGSSFSVTLPKKWVEAHRLKEQDFVVSFQDGDSLVLLPSSILQKQFKKKIHLGGLKEDDLRREIIACYILGFDELEILGKPITKEERLTIRRTAQALAGFEIIEDSTNLIVIKNILHPEKFSFNESIDKMFSMMYSMFQDAVASVTKNEKKLAQDVIERDYDIDKFYFLILRQSRYLLQNKIFEGELKFSPLKVLYYEGIAIQLERIADHAVKIAQIVVDNHSSSFTKKLRQALEDTTQKILPLLKEGEDFVRDIDKTRAHKMLNTGPKINKLLSMFSLEIMKQDSARAGILSDSLDRLYGYIRNMAELTIDQAIIEESN